MNPRRIVAGILLIVVAAMIVYPPLSTGAVSLKLVGKGVGAADHLYITIDLIELHEEGADNRTGWNRISNKTITLDLMNPKSPADSIVKGTLHTGRYDTVSIHIASASLVTGSNQTILALRSEQYFAKISLVLKTFSESTITVQLNSDVTEAVRTGTLNLLMEATNAS
jgi:hypothetical protein